MISDAFRKKPPPRRRPEDLPQRSSQLSRRRKTPRFSWTGAFAIAAGLLFLVGLLVWFLWGGEDRSNRTAVSAATRIKNTLAFLVLGKPPQVYFLLLEKNGQEILLTPADRFSVTYRDEFVIRSVSSDAWFSKKLTVDVEGLGQQSDLGILFKGVDLVNQVAMGSERGLPPPGHRLIVRYKTDVVGAIPLDVQVTAQDWLRYAQDAGSRRQQIDYLKRALALNPDDAQVRKILAGLLRKENRLDEAAAQFRQVFSRNPRDIVAGREWVHVLIARKDYTGAVEAGRTVLKNQPQDAVTWANVALAYSHLNQWEEAVRCYEESLKIDPQQGAVRFKLAEAYEKAKKIDQAVAEYRKLAKQSPQEVPATLALAGLLVRSGRAGEAIPIYREVLQKDPGNAGAHAGLAYAYGAKGQWRDEVAAYKKSLALQPRDAVVWYNLAVAYDKAGQFSEARKAYRTVLELKPDDADAWERLAVLSVRERRYGDATRAYNRLLGLGASRAAKAYAGLGLVAQLQNQYREAESYYLKAIQAGATDPLIQVRLGMTYQKTGRPKEAAAAFEKSLSQRTTAEALEALGDYYLKEKQADQAIRIYRRQVELEPRKAAAYLNLAQAYALKGNTAKEIEIYQSALKVDPEDADIHWNLGLACERAGRYADALKAYTNAYALNPEMTRAARKIPQMKIKIMQQRHRD